MSAILDYSRVALMLLVAFVLAVTLSVASALGSHHSSIQARDTNWPCSTCAHVGR